MTRRTAHTDTAIMMMAITPIEIRNWREKEPDRFPARRLRMTAIGHRGQRHGNMQFAKATETAEGAEAVHHRIRVPIIGPGHQNTGPVGDDAATRGCWLGVPAPVDRPEIP